jgi:hypothetical protein
VDPGLERAYRRLLRAYPGSYRRRHGAEIVTTLLEMAEPGQRRPGRGEVWHLVASGLRQRFRLPAGRPLAWVFAVLALLIGGGLGAAAGSWAAEQTFADVPAAAAARAQLESLAPQRTRETTVMADQGSPWLGTQAHAYTSVSGLGGWDAEQARRQLAAEGWQVGPITHPDEYSVMEVREDGTAVPSETETAVFRAERDGLAVEVVGVLTEHTGSVTTQTWAIGNASLLPLVVACGLAGMAAGWLVAAAVTRRLRHQATGRRWTVAGAATGGVLMLALPTVAFYGNVIRAFDYAGRTDPVFTVHSALTPGGYWPFGPEALNLALFGAGTVLILAVLAVSMSKPAAGVPARTATT